MDRVVEQFGNNLRAARETKGWTQEELAHRAELSPVQISRIERGKREIRLKTLLTLIAALDIEPSDLLPNLD